MLLSISSRWPVDSTPSWERQRQAVLPGLFGWVSQGNWKAESQAQASTQGKVKLPPHTKSPWPQLSTVGEYLKLHRDYLRLSKEKPRLHKEYLRLSEESLRLHEEYLSLRKSICEHIKNIYGYIRSI